MKKLFSAFIGIIAKITGRKNLEKLLIYSAKSINVNLHIHALVQNGSLLGYYRSVLAEQFFISKILIGFFKPEEKLVLFDVGGNIGDYSRELAKHFPDAEIHAFEPVKNTFEILIKNTNGKNIQAHNLGFSDTAGTGVIFNTVNNTNTEIASVYKDVFHEIFKNDDEITRIEFNMNTIDSFCDSNNIGSIDFLKIDVEGHELSVLKGAQNLLQTKHVKVIQFEFNSHNVYSRVFLRDFYLILDGYELYRLLENGLVKLGAYNSINEIYTLQNIIAVREEISNLIESKYLKSFY